MGWFRLTAFLPLMLCSPTSAAADPAACPWVLTGASQDHPAQQLPPTAAPQGWWLVLTQGEGDAELSLAVPESTPAGARVAVPYRLVGGAGEAPCSMNLWAAGEEPPTPQGLETSPGWHVCPFDRDGPLPAGKLTLRLSCAQGVVLQLLLPHSPAPWPAPQNLLDLLAAQCSAAGAHEDARIAYEGLARLVLGTGEAATALRGAGDSAQAAGDALGAVESYLAALEQCGSDPDGWQVFGGSPGFSVIEPNDLRFILPAWDDPPGTEGEEHYFIGCRSSFDFEMQPIRVAFLNASFRERKEPLAFTWPDETQYSQRGSYSGVWRVNADNSSQVPDTCADAWARENPPSRLGDPPRSFGITWHVPEEYENEFGEWTTWLPNEVHLFEYEATGRARAGVRTSDTWFGGRMGPFETLEAH